MNIAFPSGSTTTVTVEGIGNIISDTVYDVSELETIQIKITDSIGSGSYTIPQGTVNLMHRWCYIFIHLCMIMNYYLRYFSHY